MRIVYIVIGGLNNSDKELECWLRNICPNVKEVLFAEERAVACSFEEKTMTIDRRKKTLPSFSGACVRKLTGRLVSK